MLDQGGRILSEAISLVVSIYGLAIVIAFGAAVMIRLIVRLLSYGDERMAAAAVQASAQAGPASAMQAVDGAIPAAHLVAIAAAANAVLGAHRILHIGSGAGGPVWSAEGRFAQHSSHRPSTHH